MIPVSAGVRVDNLTLPFLGGFELGWLAYPLTVLGIVAVVNVINFIDGVDGLAAGVCTIAAIALAVIALSLERNAAGVLAALTAGAALGFLRHGFPPASSFMGDTGSNLLGYLLATASSGRAEDERRRRPVFPLIVLTVPILDTGFVVAKRLKYRQPIYQADSWHFHHRMANIGFSQRRTLAYLYGWTLVMAAPRARPALRPLQRRPRPLRPALDRGDGRLRARRARLQRLPDLRPRDPQAAPGPDQPGDGRIRGDRSRVDLDGVVARLTNWLRNAVAGPFGYSRPSARSARAGRFMSPPKYVDLLVLAAALAVFLLGGFPMLGFAVGAAAWLAQRGIQAVAARRASAALAPATARRRWGSSPRRPSAASG